MSLESLRKKHPRLIYRGYQLSRPSGYLAVTYDFLLEPNIEFHPQVTLEFTEAINEQELQTFLFHLGLIELISYWKCACPPEIVVEAGHLSEDQCKWWHDLYIHGLGEFYFQNDIDFSVDSFLQIESTQTAVLSSQALPTSEAALVLAAGGKDSAVALELLSNYDIPKHAFVLNPTRAALDSARIAEYVHPVVMRRSIDPTLLKLNSEGYLNGHTPFSAYLAFAGVFAAALLGYRYVIVANEKSAEEANVNFHGLPVNHQYSKSLRFERMFRDYCARWLSPNIEYFSLLRPLYDLQIAKLFSNFGQHFSSFRSCNVNQRQDSWCRHCPKCAFVYLSLAPFVETDVLQNEIFGEDLFAREEIQQHIRALLGLTAHKPFECVGTQQESLLACRMLTEKYQASGKQLPLFISEVVAECSSEPQPQWGLDDYGQEHCLPEVFDELMRDAVETYLK